MSLRCSQTWSWHERLGQLTMGAMKDIRLWGILILALAVRAVFLMAVFADVHQAITPDSKDYANLASWWLLSGDYQLEDLAVVAPWDGSPTPRPEIFRTPGYPALLAGAAWVAEEAHGRRQRPVWQDSESPMPPAALKTILSFQVLLDLHLVLLTFFLGRSLAGHSAGLLAALLQAISPLAAAASCRILSDSIFAFMLIAAVMLLVRHFRTGGWWSLLSASLVMGVSCYVRPVGFAFSAVMALVIVCSRRGTGILSVSPPAGQAGRGAVSALPETEEATGETPVGLMGGTPMLRPRRLLRTLAFVAVIASCVAPWVARNVIVADYWGFSSFATDSMYWYSAAEIEARQQGVPVEQVREQFDEAESRAPFAADVVTRPAMGTAPCDRTPGGLARYRWAKAREIIFAHPWQYAGIHLKGDVAFWLPGATEALEVMGYTSGGKGTLDVLHRKGLVTAARHYFGGDTTAMVLAGVMAGIWLVRYLGVILCGLWRLRLRKMTSAGWLCVLLVVTACLLPGPANHPRFRVPVEPILSVAAAIGYLGLRQWRRRKASCRDAGDSGEEEAA